MTFWLGDEGFRAGTAVMSDVLAARIIKELGLSDRDCEPGTWCSGGVVVTVSRANRVYDEYDLREL